MTREKLTATNLRNGSVPAPKEWEQIPEIKEQKPSGLGCDVSLQRVENTNICVWYVGIGGLWERQSDYFMVNIPPAEGAEEFLKSKGYAEAIKHPTDGIIAPTFTWSHVIELLQEYVIMQKPQPTAEGAEEILKNRLGEQFGLLSPFGVKTHIAAMQDFAALHAQRLAEKMVEEECNDHVEQLREFHSAFGLPQRSIPTIMPSDEFKSRQNLLEEEIDELNTAYENGDIIEVADAITDCLYVLIGTALQFGIADVLDECFDEVHKSNMSKLGSDGKPIVREDGKVMKGPKFSRPELYRILKPLSHDR